MELDVEPAPARLGELGGGKDVELPALQPCLVDAERRAEPPQGPQPVVNRQRLDRGGNRVDVEVAAAGGRDQIIDRDVDDGKVAAGIPGGCIEGSG